MQGARGKVVKPSRARCEGEEKKKLHFLHLLHPSTTATATAISWGFMPKNRRDFFIPQRGTIVPGRGTIVPGRGNVWKAPLPVTIRVQEVQEVQVEKCE